MTKKDYVLIAEAIHRVKKRYGGYRAMIYEVVEALEEALQEDNSRFDRVRFRLACLEGEYRNTRGYRNRGRAGETCRDCKEQGWCDAHARLAGE